MASTVVAWVTSIAGAWEAVGAMPGAAGGDTRRSSSTNDGPGSTPGPNTGSGGSVIVERAYTGPPSADAAQKAPEPQPAAQSAHPARVVETPQHLGRRDPVLGGRTLGARPGVLPRHVPRQRPRARRKPRKGHVESLRHERMTQLKGA